MKIPKIVHYCWFGEGLKDDRVKRCIDSWRKVLPDYQVIEWNENNFDLTTIPVFCSQALFKRKWAFVSDYVRFKVLTEFGGVYLDTDMEVLKDFSRVVKDETAFVGEETEGVAGTAILGSIPNNPIFLEVVNTYQRKSFFDYQTSPDILTKILSNFGKIEAQNTIHNVKIFSPQYFYPLRHEEVFSPHCIKEDTYTIHWWNKSWSDSRITFLKQLGIYYPLRKAMEKLGMINFLKRIF